MKLIYALLVAVALNVVTINVQAADNEDSFIVCPALVDLNELLMATDNQDTIQIGYLYKSNKCFFLRTDIHVSFAGEFDNGVIKLRVYFKDGTSRIIYTHRKVLPTKYHKGDLQS